jgi:FkbM family methyltransferase
VRGSLRAWARTGRAPGYLHQVVDRYGYLLARRPMATRIPGGATIKCDLSDHVQQRIYFFGLYELIDSYLFWNLIEPGMVVVDAGANIGQYSLLASARVGSAGRVYSFEPVPQVYSRLRSCVTDNSLRNITLNEVALWDREEVIRMGMPEHMKGNLGAFTAGISRAAADAVEVRAMRLDTYASTQELTRLDFIKFDIEGAESNAIKGARETLSRFRPTILMEIYRLGLSRMGTSVEELWRQMQALDYRAWRLGYRGRDCCEVTDPSILTQENLLFCPAQPPAVLFGDWNYRTVLRWARSAW